MRDGCIREKSGGEQTFGESRCAAHSQGTRRSGRSSLGFKAAWRYISVLGSCHGAILLGNGVVLAPMESSRQRPTT